MIRTRRAALAQRSRSIRNLKRDDDSNRSHRALAPAALYQNATMNCRALKIRNAVRTNRARNQWFGLVLTCSRLDVGAAFRRRTTSSTNTIGPSQRPTTKVNSSGDDMGCSLPWRHWRHLVARRWHVDGFEVGATNDVGESLDGCVLIHDGLHLFKKCDRNAREASKCSAASRRRVRAACCYAKIAPDGSAATISPNRRGGGRPGGRPSIRSRNIRIRAGLLVHASGEEKGSPVKRARAA